MHYIVLFALCVTTSCSYNAYNQEGWLYRLAQQSVSCLGSQKPCYDEMAWVCQQQYVVDVGMSAISVEVDPVTGKHKQSDPAATFIFRCTG